MSHRSQRKGQLPRRLMAHIVDMPDAHSRERTDAVKMALIDNIPHETIARHARYSVRQVGRIKRNLLNYGTVRKPKNRLQGRPQKLTEEQEDVCIKLTCLLT